MKQNYLKKYLYLFTLLLAYSVHSQSIFYTQSFETESSGYSFTNNYGKDDEDFFERTDIAGAPAQAVFTYSGYDGNFFIAGEDIDSIEDGNGSKLGEVLIPGIDISGQSALTLTAAFASGTDQDIDEVNDHIWIEVNIDNTGWTEIGRFEADPNTTAADGTGGQFAEDTTGNGHGDGTALTGTFTDFTWPIVGTGSSMDVKITMKLNSGDEEAAFDNVRISSAFPTAGSVIITEVLDSSEGASYEYLELFNNSSEIVSLSTSKLIRLDASTGNSQYVFDFGTDETNSSNDVLIPAYGFLIIARGSDRAAFNTAKNITLPSGVNFNGGHTNLYFGTGRRWSLKTGGTADTNDGTLIDDTLVGVGSTKDYRNIFTNAFVTGSTSEGTPGTLEYLLYTGGAWVNATAMDATTGTKDVYFYDDYSISANAVANTIGINTGKTVTANTATQITVNSDLTVNGNFTLNSGASLIVDGSSTGNITFKKTLDTDNWYLMSVPVSGEDLANIKTNNSLASGSGQNRGISFYNNNTGAPWSYVQFDPSPVIPLRPIVDGQ